MIYFSAIVPSLGKEQFVAFYLSAGVISSLFSYTHKLILRDAALSMGAVSWFLKEKKKP